MSKGRPFVLVIMDGWGVAQPWGGNATAIARTPNISSFFQKAPRAIIGAAEESVGLPKGECGNSEVGHLNIGSGRVVRQDLTAITESIENGSFYDNPVLKDAFAKARDHGGRIHFMGLMSDGGVHSHTSHIFALLEMAKKEKVDKVILHVFTDGRDSDTMDALHYISELDEKLKKLPKARIATLSGRFFGMDREFKWDRTEKVYRAITEGIGVEAMSAESAVSEAYRENKTDEFILPTVIRGKEQTKEMIKDNDVVIFFNYRADRSRQLTQALIEPEFTGFRRNVVRKNLTFVTFNIYQEDLHTDIAFRPDEIKNSLAEVFQNNKLKQLHITETAKYPHVTYFFNGGREEPFGGEERKMLDSPKVATYDQKPEMSAKELTDELIKSLGEYDFIVVNYPNGDMVGHSGSLKAAVIAVQVVDECVGRVWQAVEKIGGAMIVTADHGNVEQMVNPITGKPDTEHTTNPVPLFFLTSNEVVAIRRTGVLADVAPTILEYMGVEIPAEMTGQSLLLGNVAETKEESAKKEVAN